MRVNDATLTVWPEYGDGEPRMLDTDVAKRIGLKQSVIEFDPKKTKREK